MDTLDDKLQLMHQKARQLNSPQRRNGFELGDAVKLPNIDAVFEVVDLGDVSLVGIRAPSGRVVKAGWRVLSRVNQQTR